MSAHSALADRIAAAAPQLAERVATGMGGDPFWAARFGGDGQATLRAQAVEHAERLARSLRVGDSAPVTQRMREVRADAVRQGMTTRHLALGSRWLDDAIRAMVGPDTGAARTMIDRAVLALRYDDGAASAVQDYARQMAEDAVVTLRGVHLGDVEGEAQWIEAVEVLISYLADAVAARDPGILAAHARWLERNGAGALSPAEPAAMLAALEGALDELPAPARAEAAACLTAARRALGTSSP